MEGVDINQLLHRDGWHRVITRHDAVRRSRQSILQLGHLPGRLVALGWGGPIPPQPSSQATRVGYLKWPMRLLTNISEKVLAAPAVIATRVPDVVFHITKTTLPAGVLSIS